jgi:hypothetical protein
MRDRAGVKQCGSALERSVRQAEDEVMTCARKLLRLKDPKKKLKLIWQLAWMSSIRDLEDFRPAGGFAHAQADL